MHKKLLLDGLIRFKIFSYFFLFLICLLFNVMQAEGQWQQNEFIIGAYLGPVPIPAYENGVLDTVGFIKQIKFAKEANFNFSTGNGGPAGDIGFQNLSFNLYSKYGIKSLYYNPLFGQNITIESESQANNAYQFVKGLDSISSDAFYGYNLIDEPPLGASEQVIKWVKYLKNSNPDKLIYVNLLPVYGFNNDINKYNGYLQSYLGDTIQSEKLDVVSYDFYPFIGSSLRPYYFYNLEAIMRMAYNRPVWIYVLSSPHSHYLYPDQYMLNFMVFCPLAYGVKGILYFTYQTTSYDPAAAFQYGSAIIDTSGNPTELYSRVKQVNQFITKVAGPVMMNSVRLGTYHVSSNTWNQRLEPDDFLNDKAPLLSSVGDENILSGIFQSKSNSKEFYLFMVNKADKYLSNVFVALKGDYSNNVFISKHYLNDNFQNDSYQAISVNYDAEANETWFYIDFSGGEGRMIKVEGVESPYQNIFISDKEEIELYPNPTEGDIKMGFSIPQQSNIKIQVFDMAGRLKMNIKDNVLLSKGKYHQILDLTNLVSGTYIVSLFAGYHSIVSKKIFISR